MAVLTGSRKSTRRISEVQDILSALYVAAQAAIQTLANEEGQDLLEYVLVGAAVAFAAIAGMNLLAPSINSVLNAVGDKVVSNT